MLLFAQLFLENFLILLECCRTSIALAFQINIIFSQNFNFLIQRRWIAQRFQQLFEKKKLIFKVNLIFSIIFTFSTYFVNLFVGLLSILSRCFVTGPVHFSCIHFVNLQIDDKMKTSDEKNEKFRWKCSVASGLCSPIVNFEVMEIVFDRTPNKANIIWLSKQRINWNCPFTSQAKWNRRDVLIWLLKKWF